MGKPKKIKKRCVTGKQIHINLESAQFYQKKLTKNWEILEAYQCRHCNGWHLGHTKGQKKKHLLEKKLNENQACKKKKAVKNMMEISDIKNQDIYYSRVTK